MLQEVSLKPIFVQIAEWVEDEIMNGGLKEGEQVPSTNQFAVQFQINPATAGKGINLLVEDGVIYKKRGIGMFVCDGAYQKILGKRREKFCSEYIKNLLLEAKKLGIEKNELLQMIEKSE